MLKAVGKAHQILLGARYSSDQTEQTVKELEELFPELKGMKVTTTGKQAYSAEDWGDGGSWGNQNTGGWGNKSHMVGWDNSSRTL